MDAIKRGLLEKLPFWDHLSKEEQDMTVARSVATPYLAGQNIRGENMDCLGVLLVKSGVLRTYLLSDDGREVTMYRLRSGSICVMSASCILDAVSFDVQIDAEEESEILLIPVDLFSTLCKNNIYVESYSYKMAAERFSDVIAAVERMLFLSLEERLTSFLIDEASVTKSDEISLTHEQIASAIGSAREAVSRTLKHMEAEGTVALSRGCVKITNKGMLYQKISKH